MKVKAPSVECEMEVKAPSVECEVEVKAPSDGDGGEGAISGV